MAMDPEDIGRMILAQGVRAYTMVIPFLLNGRTYPSGFIFVVYDVGEREAYLAHEWANLAALDAHRRPVHTEASC
jgi:hypothetical protein